ncbi:hypothetical protein BCR35DRAFT_336366, partial [Leucosporidium creatinivorum]
MPEHLSRHQQARHSDIKEFVCATCNKGFARRDILRRHELGHQKNKDSGDDTPAPKAKPKAKREPAKKRNTDSSDISIEAPPAKISRASRACTACSKSKLRCDGEQPCSRCRRGGVECSFERETPGAVDHPSKSPSDRSEGESASLVGDSGEDEGGYHNGGHPGMMGGHPGWSMPGMSPYGLPLRPPSLGPHGALPPSSFQQPMGIGSPSHYYSRPPDQFGPGGPGGPGS